MCALEITKVTQLIGHQNPIYALAMDHGAFFSAGNDKGIVRWDLETLRFDRVLCPVRHTVYALHLLPGTHQLIAGMRDGTVTGTDTISGEQEFSLNFHKQPVFALGSVSGKSQGIELIIGSEDGTASVWSVESNIRQLIHLSISASSIRCLAVSPDEKWLCFGARDGRIYVYHAEDYSFYTVLDAHTMPVTSLLFSPDGQYLLSAGRDARLIVFDVNGPDGHFKMRTDLVPHMFAIYSMQFHPVLPVFATASRDKAVKIWSLEDFRLLKSISTEKGWEAHRLSVNALFWQSDGSRLFTAGDDKLIMVWDLIL